jgi:cytochrome c peroxidase
VVQTLSLGAQPAEDAVRHGEILFHDARVCFQGWQSCATCHPEGRTDGLSWDLMNDGLGNPKSAKSLLLAGKTPPAMAHGVRDTMQVAVASGYKYILFHVPTAEEITDAAAYIDALRPVRSPRCNRDGSLSPAAQRGKAIFQRKDVGCAKCHPGPLFTDLKVYDVGTRQDFDSSGEFDTPTLVELYRTAPYLHDGSAVTLLEVLSSRNKGDRHGKTSQLSAKELRDLEEYLLSL